MEKARDLEEANTNRRHTRERSEQHHMLHPHACSKANSQAANAVLFECALQQQAAAQHRSATMSRFVTKTLDTAAGPSTASCIRV